MGKKQHATLCDTFERKFPKLFNFQNCALLFVDAADGSLFKFHSAEHMRDSKTHDKRTSKGLKQKSDEYKESVMEPQKLKPIIVKLPKDRGITGIAIQTKEVQVVQNGDHNHLFAAEIDNSIGIAVVSNCLIGPCFDSTGQLRGVIQLVNKLDTLEPITL